MCIANRRHGAAAWTFVRQHWDEANERFPTQHDRAHGRLGEAAQPTDTVVADVQAFFSEHPIAQAAKTLEQMLERQRVNAALRGPRARPLRRHASSAWGRCSVATGRRTDAVR